MNIVATWDFTVSFLYSETKKSKKIVKNWRITPSNKMLHFYLHNVKYFISKIMNVIIISTLFQANTETNVKLPTSNNQFRQLFLILIFKFDQNTCYSSTRRQQLPAWFEIIAVMLSSSS